MATRNKTSVFLRYRDSQHAHRSVLGKEPIEASHDSRTMRRNLLDGNDRDGLSGLSGSDASDIWAEAAATVRGKIGQIKQEMSYLRKTQQMALRNIVQMEDDTEEEQAVEIKTGLITSLFQHCQRIIKDIDSAPNPGTETTSGVQHAALRKNVVRQLAGELSELSRQFRKMQTDYMGKVREQSKFDEFGTGPGASSSSSLARGNNDDVVDIDDLGGAGHFDRGFTDRQHMEVEHNAAIIDEREQAIREIQRSVEELATMMKELMTLVIDQGTIVDRIDYNVEQVSQHVERGLEQLQKASEHQKSARYKLCIILLIVLIALLGSVIVFKKLLGKKKKDD